MIQIKERFAGNGHPLPGTVTPSWVILDTPDRLKAKDRPISEATNYKLYSLPEFRREMEKFSPT